MDLSNPISNVIPSAHGVVLAVLARTGTKLSGRQIAGLTRGAASQTRVNQVLGELADSGLVIREVHPPAHLYHLNRDHLAADAIVLLATINQRLLEKITVAAQEWELPAEALWLFGSLARGEAGPGSDVDLVAVRPEQIGAEDPIWVAQLQDLVASVEVWTGNACNILEYSTADFQRLLASREPVLVEAARDAVVLIGSPGLLRTTVGAR